MRFKTFAAIYFLIIFLPSRLGAQTVEEQLRQMAAEIRQLRQELDQVKEELRQTETLPLIQAQVEEQAQTKVESNSRFPVKLFGTIVSNTFVNTGEPNWLDLGNAVLPRPAGMRTGSFSSSLRQSRIGAILQGPPIGSVKTSGLVAMDFFGGIPNFQTGQVMGLPRLLYAFARFEGEKTAAQIGQDHMILAPKDPTSLAGMAFPLLFRSGNLYLRAPQIRGERTFGNVRIVGGILAPVAGDFNTANYEFVPPNLAGERSRTPAVQSRVSWQRPNVTVGFSGHYSSELYVTGTRPSRAFAIDFDGVAGRFGIGGELFTGENIDQFGASLGQIAKSRGGFGEIRFAATSKLDFNAGYGTDRLYNSRRFTEVSLGRNSSIFANTIYRLTPEVGMSLEWRKLQTRPLRIDARTNNHFNLTVAYSF